MKEIALLLHESTSLLKRRFEIAARPEKLTLMQWRVLGLLSRKGPMRQAELVEEMNASPMTVSGVAERLEDAGLVARSASAEDSRAKDVALTAAGEAKVEIMREISGEVFGEALAGIPREDLDGLVRTLSRIIENLGGEDAARTGKRHER